MINKLEISERILVCDLKNNEVEAFDHLFYQYAQKLFRFSFTLLRNKEDAKDIVQETFSRIWNLRSQLDPSRSFKSYVFSISYHLIIDQLRERLKDQCFRRNLEGIFGHSYSDENYQMDFVTVEREINHIAEKLPARRKEIYFMSRSEGLSHHIIAEKLGITSKTVENQINLSLKYIKSNLSSELI